MEGLAAKWFSFKEDQASKIGTTLVANYSEILGYVNMRFMSACFK